MPDNTITEDEFKIAKYRLETMPAHLEIGMGELGSFTKEELKDHMNQGTDDEVARAYTQMQMAGLRAFKEV
ncbi:MAG: hypothetical protein MUP63_01450 [Candidatus Nanohaloarchaeota archaeon QJJ-7]|nr:hypothetical protein [Candidatus Nanohaloarchaeota archaeon QJJ-7]